MSIRLRIVVADDERPARSFLVALLRSFEDVTLVGEAASGKEAVTVIEREKPDLALLDWQMPELDGMGVVRMLKRPQRPLIAFVTAYDEYAVRAFEVNDVATPSIAPSRCSSMPKSPAIKRHRSTRRSTRTRRPPDCRIWSAFPCATAKR
jgi:CheY-like chemotaxis protein